MARRPPSPAVVTRALKLLADMSAAEVAERLRKEGVQVSGRTILEWAQGKNGARVLVTPGSTPPIVEAHSAAATAPAEVSPPVPEAPPVPAHLDGAARRLWIIRSRIDAIRNALALADNTSNILRISPLTKQLIDLLEQEERLAPPAPADPHEEERRHRAAADACVAKIKAGIRAAKAA